MREWWVNEAVHNWFTFAGQRERDRDRSSKLTERLNRQAILDEKMKKFLAVRLWLFIQQILMHVGV